MLSLKAYAARGKVAANLADLGGLSFRTVLKKVLYILIVFSENMSFVLFNLHHHYLLLTTADTQKRISFFHFVPNTIIVCTIFIEKII